MLDRNFDQVIIGKSGYSVLLGLQLLKCDRRTLILDDQRVGYGNFYQDFISRVTVQTLKNWGEDLAVEPLLNLDDYLRPSTYIFHIDKPAQARCQIRLGDRPSANMLELERKLGHPKHQRVPAGKTFDDELNAGFKLLGDRFYRARSLKNFDLKFFLASLPSELVDWATPIVASCQARKELDFSNPWDTFFYVAQAVFHNKFSLNFSTLELWHLLIEVLSPRYEIDTPKLETDLMAVYRQRGGQFKRAQVSEWMFYKSRPWSIELSSYEGIIHPQELILMGSPTLEPTGLEIDIGQDVALYGSVSLEYGTNLASLSDDNITHFLFSEQDVGTDLGLWCLRRQGAGEFSIAVALRQREGAKIEFMMEPLMTQAKVRLQQHFPLLLPKLSFKRVVAQNEVWIDEHFYRPPFYRTQSLESSEVLIRQVSDPSTIEYVDKVSYFGPIRRDRFGLVSSLLEIKSSLPDLQ